MDGIIWPLVRAYSYRWFQRSKSIAVKLAGLSVMIVALYLTVSILTNTGLVSKGGFRTYNKLLPSVFPLFYLTTKDELTLLYEKKKKTLPALCSLPWEPRHLLFSKSFFWSLYLEGIGLAIWFSLLVFNIGFLHFELTFSALVYFGILPWLVIFPVSLILNYLIFSLPLTIVKGTMSFVRLVALALLVAISLDIPGTILQGPHPIELFILVVLWIVGLSLPFFVNKNRAGVC